MDEKELEAHKMMQNMKGMPGNAHKNMEMYSREEIAKMQQQLGGGSPLGGEDEGGEGDEGGPQGGHSKDVNFLDFLRQIGRDIAKRMGEWYKTGHKMVKSLVDWCYTQMGGNGKAKRKKREL